MLVCVSADRVFRLRPVCARSRAAQQINYEEFVKMMMCVSPRAPALPLHACCQTPDRRTAACGDGELVRARAALWECAPAPTDSCPCACLTGPSKRVGHARWECPVSYLFPCHTNTKSYSPAGTERRGSTCARPAGPTPPASRHKKATLSRTAACLQSTGSVRQQCVIDCVRLSSVPWIW